MSKKYPSSFPHATITPEEAQERNLVPITDPYWEDDIWMISFVIRDAESNQCPIFFVSEGGGVAVYKNNQKSKL